jgi:hypothetical protein
LTFESLRYGCNLCLCAVGAVLYAVLIFVFTLGAWPMSIYVFVKLIVMMAIGLPVAITTLPTFLCLGILGGYYSLSSLLIARFFRMIPILRPTLFVGCAFLAGLAITYTLVAQFLSFDFGTRTGAIAIGVTGIVLTRLFMSWLFNKVPVARLAVG